MQQLQIKLFTANEFNKNYNAIIDRACQELENELRKILPEGHKLDNFVLARATLAMNSKLRRKEAIAAYEMHTARKLESGHNLQLSDAKLRQSQLSARRPVTANVEPVRPKPGDTVTPVAAQDKHTVRDMYMLTAADQHNVTVQKILHPLSSQPTKFMAKQYVTDHKNVRVIHTAPQITLPKSTNLSKVENIPSCQESDWNPIKPHSWDSDSEYDSEEVDCDSDMIVPH